MLLGKDTTSVSPAHTCALLHPVQRLWMTPISLAVAHSIPFLAVYPSFENHEHYIEISFLDWMTLDLTLLFTQKASFLTEGRPWFGKKCNSWTLIPALNQIKLSSFKNYHRYYSSDCFDRCTYHFRRHRKFLAELQQHSELFFLF